MLIDNEVSCIKKVLHNNTGAYECLVNEYQNLIYGMNFHLLEDRDEAERIAIDVFVEAYRNIKIIKRKFLPSIFRDAFFRASQCENNEIKTNDATACISMCGAMCQLSDQELRLLILHDLMHVPYEKLRTEYRIDISKAKKRIRDTREKVIILMRKS